MWGVRRLSTLTLGVVGMGKIGRLLVRRMAPFGFRILGHDLYLSDEQIRSLGATPAALDDLLREADLVSLHVPLTPETRHLIDVARLSLMKPSAAIVNTSRGPVVDEAALIEALHGRRIAGAMLDVYENYRIEPGHPLFALENVILTPHLAAVTQESRARASIAAADEMLRMLRGERPRNLVNPEVLT
jgi:phosphoglycerate dehydrogenase-like enzyme